MTKTKNLPIKRYVGCGMCTTGLMYVNCRKNPKSILKNGHSRYSSKFNSKSVHFIFYFYFRNHYLSNAFDYIQYIEKCVKETLRPSNPPPERDREREWNRENSQRMIVQNNLRK